MAEPTPLNPPVLPPVLRPTVRFMLSHPAYLVALGFGSGLPRWAPGTFGTLFAWAGYHALAAWMSPQEIGVWIAICLPVAWWAGAVTARRMRALDPSAIVCDEIVAFWIVLWLVMPAGWAAQLAAFALFRFFDAVKPGPVEWADSLFKGYGWRGGLGILLDDLVAALCTLVVIALWRVL